MKAFFTNNFNFFWNLRNNQLSQKEVYRRYRISESTLIDLRKGKTVPKQDDLFRKLARFCSDVSGIPLSEFDEGRALLEKDFKKIYENYAKERKLQDTESPSFKDQSGRTLKGLVSEKSPSVEKLSTLEQELPYIIREIVSGSIDSPTPSATLKSAIDLLRATGMIPELHTRFIDLLKTHRGFYGTGREPNKEGGV